MDVKLHETLYKALLVRRRTRPPLEQIGVVEHRHRTIKGLKAWTTPLMYRPWWDRRNKYLGSVLRELRATQGVGKRRKICES